MRTSPHTLPILSVSAGLALIPLWSGLHLSEPETAPGLIDRTPPVVTIDPPSDTFSVDTVSVAIEWCDNESLDPSTRLIKLNGDTVTSDFDFEWASPTGQCNARAFSEGVVTLDEGSNTLIASICDSYQGPLRGPLRAPPGGGGGCDGNMGSKTVRYTYDPPDPPPPLPEGDSVLVLPDASALRVEPNGNGVVVFTAYNTRLWEPQTVNFSCQSAGRIVCDSVIPGSAYLLPGGPESEEGGNGVLVQLHYTAGDSTATADSLTLRADGAVVGWDEGTYSVVYGWDVTNASTNNGANLDRGRCVSTGAGPVAAFQCGDLVLAHGFPAYQSLNESRSLALVYNSASVDVRPVFEAEVHVREGTELPEQIGVEIDLDRDLSIEVGPIFYTGPDSVIAEWGVGDSIAPSRVDRLSVPVGASGRGTGAVPYRATVTYYFAGGPTKEYIFEDYFLIVNRQASPYGAGWDIASLMRLFPQDSSVVLALGDGTVQRFKGPDTEGHFESPPGVYSNLTEEQGGTYTWESRGGLVTATFDSWGLLDSVSDLANNTAHYYWTTQGGEPALDSIVDAAGEVVDLTYQSGMLASVEIPGYAPVALKHVGATLDTIIDPDGVQTVMWYDTLRLTHWEGRALGPWNYLYDELGRLEEVRPPTGYGYVYTRSHLLEGAPLNGTGSPGNPAALGEADSAYVGHTDGRGHLTKFWIDRFGAPVKIVQPEIYDPIVIERDELSFPTRIAWPSGRVVEEYWETGAGTLDSLVEVSRLGATTRYEYHPSFKLVTKVTPPTGAARAVSFAYDPVTARRISVTNGQGDVTQFKYNERGLVDSIIQPLDVVPTEFRYNGTWNLSEAIEAGQDASHRDTTWLSYDATGTRVISIEDAEGTTTTFQKDAIGRDTAVVQSGGELTPWGLLTARTRFVHDDAARERFRYDAEGRQTSWRYDAAGNVVMRCTGALDGPLCTSLQYDAAGNLSTKTDRDGRFLTYWHDGLDRLIRKTVPQDAPDLGPYPSGFFASDTVEFTYTADGLLYSAKNFYAEVKSFYNDDETVSREQSCMREWDSAAKTHCQDIYYSYDADGVRSALSFTLEGETDSLYWRRDARGISRIGNTYHRPDGDNPLVFTVNHDANGRLEQVTADLDGWTYDERFSYNDKDLLVSHELGLEQRDTLEYDRVGRKTYDGANDYAYDGLGRLRDSDGPGDDHEVFDYDLAGNRTSWIRTGAAAAEWTYDYDGHGRLQSSHELYSQCSPQFQYDGEGRREQEDQDSCAGETLNEYRYTAEGRLVSHKKTYEKGNPGIYWTERRIYWYDALGRRILMFSPDSTWYYVPVEDYGAWRFYYAGNDLVARTESNPLDPDMELKSPYGLGAWFTPGLGPNQLLAGWDSKHVQEEDKTRIYIRDHVGSVDEVRNATGATVGTAAYSAFGEVSGDAPSEAGFAGGLAAGDLVQFHNRYYDPLTGQFMTEDPIGFAGGGNLYAYAGNNPVTYTDPFGLCVKNDEKCGLLVKMLRALEGSQFQRAAQALDDYKGGRVDFKKYDQIKPYMGYYIREKDEPEVGPPGPDKGPIVIAVDLDAGDKVMTAYHEATHLPTWHNFSSEPHPPESWGEDFKAWKQLGSLRLFAPRWYERLLQHDRDRLVPPPQQ